MCYAGAMTRSGSSVVVEWAQGERPERRARIEAEIRRVTAGLVGRGAVLVVLFGSRARGETRPDSDADLLAVLPLPSDRPPMARLADLYADLAPKGIDLFAYDPEEFEEMKRVSSLVRDALARGIVLHGG